MTATETPGRGERLADWFDGRLGIHSLGRRYLRKVFPDHWSFLLGEICLYSFVVLILTGVYLTLFFHPSMNEVTYHGSYVPLNGVRMSEAYASTLEISFDVRGGLLIRQIHHWAALVFVAGMLTHMMRHFFTGSFRKPREVNWVFGWLLLFLGLFEGLFGYSLPDDLLSGTGMRFVDGALLSVPIVGTYLSMFLFGGEYPGDDIVARFYSLHVLVIPGIMAALVVAHVLLVIYHKHTQFAGPGRTERNVVGARSCRSTWRRRAVSSSSSSGCWRCSRRWRRSTRCGRTAPTAPTRSPPARSPTGIWASPRGWCGSCRAGRSRCGVTRWCRAC
ncbi:hypothetical protein GCM10027074_44980 [Streptomyces deserti]